MYKRILLLTLLFVTLPVLARQSDKTKLGKKLINRLTSKATQISIDNTPDPEIKQNFSTTGHLLRKQFDTNGDKKFDFHIFYDRAGQFSRQERDRNYDGEIDQWTRVIPKHGGTLIVLSDNNFDKFVDRSEVFTAHHKGYRVKIDWDSNGDKKLDKRRLISIPQQAVNQEDEEVHEELRQFRNLRPIFDGRSQADKRHGWYYTDMNIKTSKNCKSTIEPQKFHVLIEEMLSEGLSCLWKEYEKHGRYKQHIFELGRLLGNEDQPIKIDCKHLRESIVANASLPGDDDFPDITIDITHLKYDSRHHHKGTLFHELFHLMGYSHGIHWEYAYACHDCCFGDIVYPAEKFTACNVCTKTITGNPSQEDLHDLVKYSHRNHRNKWTYEYILNHLIENPEDKIAAMWLADVLPSPVAAPFFPTVEPTWNKSPLYNRPQLIGATKSKHWNPKEYKAFASAGKNLSDAMEALIADHPHAALQALQRVQILKSKEYESVSKEMYRLARLLTEMLVSKYESRVEQYPVIEELYTNRAKAAEKLLDKFN